MRRLAICWAAVAAIPLVSGCYGQKLLRQPVTVAETAEDTKTIQQQQAELERRIEAVERQEAELAEMLRALRAENALRWDELQNRLLAVDSQLRDALGSRGSGGTPDTPYWTATPRARAPREEPPSPPSTTGQPDQTTSGEVSPVVQGAGAPADSVMPDSVSAILGQSVADEAEAKRVYDQAYLDLSRGNYSLAILGFREFLRRVPDSDLADNAQYWIGESFYAQRDFDRAIQEFLQAVDGYPRGDKHPAALLKIGYSFLQTGDRDSARSYLRRLVEEFPNSDEAELARNKIRSAGLE